MIKMLFAGTVLLLNALILVPFALMPLALVKLVLPFVGVRKVVDTCANFVAETWIGVNSTWMGMVNGKVIEARGLEGLKRRGWYLVSSNHQSWVDILVLQHVFNRKIPLLKFFLKQELIYVPIMGAAWWALDFPFMRRSGDPKGFKRDLEVARKSCEKFAHVPTSVINFLEGTRFDAAKHGGSGSPYRYLLKPKTGGLAIALATLGDQFHSMLDITIAYETDPAPTFMHLLSGRLGKVIVTVRERPIPEIFGQGDPTGDPVVRKALQEWVNALWAEKDAELATLKQELRQGV
jgi:1-acyl-sn-glycerol-3-phosphate acyltransferase